MSALLLSHVQAGARAERVTLSAWVRRACEERALRAAVRVVVGRARKPL